MLTVAIAATLTAIAVPALNSVNDATKLSNATQQVERTLQSARMRAVSQNTALRFRSNCPVAGYYRIIEVLGTTADNSLSRCDISTYPWPAPDHDLATTPNFDGQLRQMINDATISSAWVEFRPDGTAWNVDPITNAVTTITTPVTVKVTRNGACKNISVNALGKVLTESSPCIP